MALNHHTPIEIMTGRIPSTPVEMTTWNGILMQDTSKIPITCGMITKYIKDMKQAIQELHSEVTDKDRHLRNLRLKKQKKQLPNFNIGTYVMVAAHEANKGKRQSKTQVLWHRPDEIVSTLSPFV